MRKKLVVFCVVASFSIFIWGAFAFGQMTRITKLESLYRACIDELISKCESKANRCNSKLKNIRRASALYSLKVSFYKSYKTDLIQDMVKENIGEKEHKIHYYLNKRFFDTLREAVKYTHLSELQSTNT